MTGKETVKYLKSKYTEGQDYAHITIVVRKREVQVHSPSSDMQADLKGMGFEICGWWAIKSWPKKVEEKVEEATEEKAEYTPRLSVSYSGMISLGLQVIGQAEWNKATKQYEIPAGFQIPDWAK